MVVVFAISTPIDQSHRQFQELTDEQVATSKYITENLARYRCEDLVVHTKYSDIIAIYLDFLRLPKHYNHYLKKTVITDHHQEWTFTDNHTELMNAEVLVTCFNLESYFVDDSFFAFLMKRVYNIWDIFQPYIESLPDSRLFYLYTPFPLVPTGFASSPSFRREWFERNSAGGDDLVSIRLKTQAGYFEYYSKTSCAVDRLLDYIRHRHVKGSDGSETDNIRKLAVTKSLFKLGDFQPVEVTTWLWDEGDNLQSKNTESIDWQQSTPTYRNDIGWAPTRLPPVSLAAQLDIKPIFLSRSAINYQSNQKSKRRR